MPGHDHYRVPVMNLTCNIWLAYDWALTNLPPSRPPDSVSICQLSLGDRIRGGTAGSEGVFAVWLALPPGWNINDGQAYEQTWGDTVECPAGTGRYYVCIGQDDVGLGFANSYRSALLAKVDAFFTGSTYRAVSPWPTLTPNPPPPVVPVTSDASSVPVLSTTLTINLPAGSRVMVAAQYGNVISGSGSTITSTLSGLHTPIPGVGWGVGGSFQVQCEIFTWITTGGMETLTLTLPSSDAYAWIVFSVLGNIDVQGNIGAFANPNTATASGPTAALNEPLLAFAGGMEASSPTTYSAGLTHQPPGADLQFTISGTIFTLSGATGIQAVIAVPSVTAAAPSVGSPLVGCCIFAFT
jgi:hypothetical protein